MPNPSPRHGSIAITWLRQAGFLLEGPSATVAIDPFLTEFEAQLVAPPLRPEDLADVDLVLATHEHDDHLDLPAWQRLAEASTRPRFVVAKPLLPMVVAAGIDGGRIIGARIDTPLNHEGVTVTPVPARHGVWPADAYDHGRDQSDGLDRYLGYVVDLEGIRVYHAGDTIVYDDMVERLRRLDVDVALLPINGRDHFREQRGIVGNLDVREAAELAAAIGTDLVIPMHYDTAPGNTGSAGAFVDYVHREFPNLPVVAPALGRRFVYTPG